MSRLLEALWRTVRREFDSDGLDTIIQTFEKDIVPSLKKCHELESKTRSDFGLSGLDFEAEETLVKSIGGFEKLVEISKGSLTDEGMAAQLLRCIVKTFISSMNVESDARRIGSLVDSVKKTLEELTTTGGNLIKNFWEYPKAAKFIGITEDYVKSLVSEKMKMDGILTLQQLESISKENKQYLEDVSANLGTLNKKLTDLDGIFKQIQGVDERGRGH
jgi:hypothetical protein